MHTITKTGLLSLSEFFAYNSQFFNYLGSSEIDFTLLLTFYEKYSLLTPVAIEKSKKLYSRFQLSSLYRLEQHRLSTLVPFATRKHKGKIINFPIENWQEVFKNVDIFISNQLSFYKKYILLLETIYKVYYPYYQSGGKTVTISGDFHDWRKDRQAFDLKKRT